jgi:hypothetical protein
VSTAAIEWKSTAFPCIIGSEREGCDMARMILVRADWDGEPKVWVATSDDVGLVTEAETFDALTEKTPIMITDLLEGEHPEGEILIEIVAHASARVAPRAA